MIGKLVWKVISGGQTGADHAGLRAAKDSGIETGGKAPRGFKTEEGFKPELEIEFNLTESFSSGYKTRTVDNVLDSDGTIIFKERPSGGSELTETICRNYRKPYWINPGVDDIRLFVGTHHIEVLNIAGNRESISPGIERRVYGLLMRAFKEEPIEE